MVYCIYLLMVFIPTLHYCVGTRLDISDNDEDPTFSRGGRLVFEEVQYEDGGDYTCTAENELSDVSASTTLRLRVRGRLRESVFKWTVN